MNATSSDSQESIQALESALRGLGIEATPFEIERWAMRYVRIRQDVETMYQVSELKYEDLATVLRTPADL